MGLDMYLYKKFHINEIENLNTNEPIIVNGCEYYLNPCDMITVEVAYWRKANAIHKWFVENCCDFNDDCCEHYVSRLKLEELLNTCKEIMENKNMAEKLLPTQEGFFFGDTDYNDSYYDDIELTIEQITNILKTSEPSDYFVYQASW